MDPSLSWENRVPGGLLACNEVAFHEDCMQRNPPNPTLINNPTQLPRRMGSRFVQYLHSTQLETLSTNSTTRVAKDASLSSKDPTADA